MVDELTEEGESRRDARVIRTPGVRLRRWRILRIHRPAGCSEVEKCLADVLSVGREWRQGWENAAEAPPIVVLRPRRNLIALVELPVVDHVGLLPFVGRPDRDI